jgi:hypothetical protein
VQDQARAIFAVVSRVLSGLKISFIFNYSLLADWKIAFSANFGVKINWALTACGLIAPLNFGNDGSSTGSYHQIGASRAWTSL